MVNRIVVGAHYGLKDWLAQRVTAVYMALFTLAMAPALLFCVDGYEHWRALMAHGVVRFFSVLFVLCLCYHAWVGVRDIWMDYVKSTAVRLTLHILTALVLAGNAVWAVQILWRP
jgi:succinate dehydrogenase / fumarate reductase membrane anchor subunit